MEAVGKQQGDEGTETAMMGYGFGMGLAGWIFMGLFWVAVIALVVWAVVALLPGSRSGGPGRRETPQEILDRRFALGELDAEQYRRARDELAAAPPGGGDCDDPQAVGAHRAAGGVSGRGADRRHLGGHPRLRAAGRRGERARARHDGRRHDGRLWLGRQRPAGDIVERRAGAGTSLRRLAGAAYR